MVSSDQENLNTYDIDIFLCICTQVGNGCIGNEVGACGSRDSLRIHVNFYHYHALFPDVRIYIHIIYIQSGFIKYQVAYTIVFTDKILC